MDHATDMTITLSALAFFAVFGLVCFQRHFAKHDKLEPRMVPWIILSIACLATVFMLIVHLVNLFGFETGGRF